MNEEPEGIPSRQLLLAFFAVVLLCAVFFSLGYFLGYRQRSAANALSSEAVASPSDVPPEVNPQPPASGNGQLPSDSTSPASSTATQSSAANPSVSEPTSRPTRPAEKPAGSGVSESDIGTSVPERTVAAAKPAEPRVNPAPVETPSAPAGLLVQVAALTTEQDANNLVGVLKGKGYGATILTPQQARAKDSFFRVVTGPYRSRAEADQAKSRLAAEGFKPFVRQ